MSELKDIRVPDLGDFDSVPVIEVLVAAGDTVEKEQPLITLESDKATMEIPSPYAGKIAEVLVSEGHNVSPGSVIANILAEPTEPAGQPATENEKAASSQPGASPREERSALAESNTEAVPQPTDDPTGTVDYDTELLVLGGGPGGYTAAFRAADLGLSVTLVERHKTLGGVCLNVGCIPSKALLHAAAVIREAEHMSAHGVTFAPPKIDRPALLQWKNSVVSKLTGGLAAMAKKRGVRVIHGEGRFVGAHEMSIDTEQGTESVRFRQAIIAAGSRVFKLPGLPWDDPRVMDSTDALELADIPSKLLIIGGGIIGLEMATVYAALGSAVSVVEMQKQLIPGADADLVKPLQQRLKKQLAEIRLGSRVEAVDAQKKGLKVTFDDGHSAIYDKILVAVGRQPNGALIGAENAGVAVDERGYIAVDKHMRTSVPHIFAIGDIVGQPMLAHKATHEAKVAAEVAAGHKVAFEALVIPSVAYTDPEVSWVGLTETEAKAHGTAYEKAVFPWAASGRALGLDRTEGLTKLLFDPDSGRVLGGGIVGVNAGELIAEVAHAIEMGAEASDIALTIHPHPTLSETVALAAEIFDGSITDLIPPKRR